MDFGLIDADGNWCPDCGEPRGVCTCEENREAQTALYPDENIDTTPICWNCGEKMEWTSEYREIELEGGFMGTVYDPIYECPYCDDSDYDEDTD